MSTPTYRYTPVPFTAVHFTDNFWAPRLETNRAVTLPYNFQKCEETDRISNFEKAADTIRGEPSGEHVGIFFNDSDVFKVMEGAAYTLSLQPDPELDAYLDDLIGKVAAAQEEDGYLYTARTINPDAVDPEREGPERWSNLRVNHELYNVGHMYEAAVAHHQATGKRNFLDIAIKNADLIDKVFGPNGRRDVPGHQEIEIGLTKLYQAIGDEHYLSLAKFFLDERGHAHDRDLYGNFENPGYMQDHQPVIEQEEAVGHSVRAVYMYTGMADVATLTGDADYVAAIDRIWDNVVSKKLYLTGGIGARHKGEAFGDDYELPNREAYTETCAAIANVFWNQRMFQLHGHARYIDVLELTLYNGFLSGIALSGSKFFYSNPLAADGEWGFNQGDTGRKPWFNCSCCPTNIVRFVPSLPGYIYAVQGDELFVNLYVGSKSTVEMGSHSVSIQQETDYPWNGDIRLSITPARPVEFGLKLRIPGWAQNQPVPSDLYEYSETVADPPTIAINGTPLEVDIEGAVSDDGYVTIHRTWVWGDVVQLHLPMPVRRVVSHSAIEGNQNRVALMRGPLVYCVEGMDHGGRVTQLALPDSVNLAVSHRPDILGGITLVNALLPSGQLLTAIPCYAWAHRDVGEMAVWLPMDSTSLKK